MLKYMHGSSFEHNFYSLNTKHEPSIIQNSDEIVSNQQKSHFFSNYSGFGTRIISIQIGLIIFQACKNIIVSICKTS